MENFAVENFYGERVLDQPLDGALQWTRSVGAIKAHEKELVSRCVGQFNDNAPVGQLLGTDTARAQPRRQAAAGCDIEGHPAFASVNELFCQF